ncbi:MAG: FKBP-type peptidyl-prolyl cis-trans isomerase [Akkermansiaceae bacterium]
MTTTDSGLQYEVLEKGEGDSPGPRDQVEVHYEGRLEDGTVFDSSYERNSPAIFPLNAVIKGWTEGLQFMKPGARYRFTIPSHLAYGDKGVGALIEAGATLIFEVELIAVK